MEDLNPAEQPGSASERPSLSPGEPESTVPASGRACANCNQPAMEGDHPTPLCGQCREQFTRLTIPSWIKLFAGGVALVLLFSLFTLPRTFSLGIHLRRGEKAIAQHRYYTAEQELEKVLEKVPDNVEANGNLLIAAFYNQDFQTMGEKMKKLQGVSTSDNAELFSRIDEVVEKAGGYIPNDSFENFKTTHPLVSLIPDTAWANYFSRNPNDRYALMLYSSQLFDKNEYRACDSVIRVILKGDDEDIYALTMGASARRQLGDLEGALRYSQKMLEVNQESCLGMDSQARTLLKQKKDNAALELALKAYRLKAPDEYTMATLIMAYHFNGRTSERDAMIKRAQTAAADSSDKATLQYALDVVDKKEKFRD